MSKILKADAGAADAYVSKTLAGGPYAELWLTFSVGWHPEAKVLWSNVADFSGILAELLTSSTRRASIKVGEVPFSWWTEAGDSLIAPAGSGTLHGVEIHWHSATVLEHWVDGAHFGSVVPVSASIDKLIIGQVSSLIDPAAIAYFDDIKVGTTRGASDIFSETFESGGLAAWTSTSGAVSVVDTVELFPSGDVGTSPEGVSWAPDAKPRDAAPTWTRLDDPDTYDVATDWEIDRGRPSERNETGKGTATVNAVDSEGVIDPRNPYGPFYGKIKSMKQFALARQHPLTGEWRTRFRGFIKEWNYDVDVSQNSSDVTLSLEDAFGLFERLEMTPGNQGDTTPAGSEGEIYYPNQWSRNRLHQLLDDVGWAEDLRVIYPGNVIVGSADSTQGNLYPRLDTLMTALFDVANAEFPDVANLFSSRTGRITHYGRYARFQANDPQWGITHWKVGDHQAADADDSIALISGLSYQVSADDIINGAYALPAGVDASDVPASFVKDDGSIDEFGWSVVSWPDLITLRGRTSPDTLNFSDDAVTATKKYAQFHVDNYKDQRTRVTKISLTSRGLSDFSAMATWDLLCGIDIGHVVSLTTALPGLGGFFLEPHFVEGIRETQGPLQILNEDEKIALGLDPGAFVELADATMELDVSPASFYDENPFA